MQMNEKMRDLDIWTPNIKSTKFSLKNILFRKLNKFLSNFCLCMNFTRPVRPTEQIVTQFESILMRSMILDLR